MKWVEGDPEKPGKYVVETQTLSRHFKQIRRLESYWNGKNWSFRNQKFLRYLKEE